PQAEIVPQDDVPCLLLSAHSRSALERDMAVIETWLNTFPEQRTAVLRHVQTGRRALRWRFAMICPSNETVCLQPSLIREVVPSEARVTASELSPHALLDAWYGGATIDWPTR
ncbi:hypothetical protein, partial [Pseudomonas viridiflava]